ncbi:MAG: sensor histidine kinase [Prevotellaceae bacterium]|nr:sensor histidine kinase [Prevotellaceae bacterium]
MVMGLKSETSYQRRLFLLLVLFSLALVFCFLWFQYKREKQFKVEQLNSSLQLFNVQMLDALQYGVDSKGYFDSHKGMFVDLRVTVISTDGRVHFDSKEKGRAEDMPNHLHREEVVAAIRNGTGYTVRRESSLDGRDYFYSATCENGMVVRSALPYNMTLMHVLQADSNFIWYVLAISLLLYVAGYVVTRHLGQNISRLREFAVLLNSGKSIGDFPPFPKDELGEISNQIVGLYRKMQQAMSDSNKEHQLALHEESEKIRIKKQLTNNINHELKTPVCAIKGYLETILTNTDMDHATQRNFLEKCFAQTERLSSLLSDIATLTRMDEASMVISREPVRLDLLIEEIVNEVKIRPEEHRMRISTNVSGPLEMSGNPSLLSSIFRNLTDNALAYSGGRDIFITLLEETDVCYKFSFADNGIGVEEKHLDHIFERFYRIDKGRSRKLGGTGLGLSIVKNAVTFHGGTIYARNREHGGLEFVFTLERNMES